MPSIITVASDARLGPPRVARRLNGFDSEIDYTLEALKVVEVKASPRGSPRCMRQDDTIAAECFMKQKIFAQSRCPLPSYFLHSEIFSSSSSGPLPAGNYIAERPRATNAPKRECTPSARRRPHIPQRFTVVTGCRTASRGRVHGGILQHKVNALAGCGEATIQPAWGRYGRHFDDVHRASR